MHVHPALLGTYPAVNSEHKHALLVRQLSGKRGLAVELSCTQCGHPDAHQPLEACNVLEPKTVGRLLFLDQCSSMSRVPGNRAAMKARNHNRKG